MIVAVFGDIHGNLPGMYQLCESWQRAKKQHIDLILQTGDIGLWQSYDEMDKATKKHYARDQSELASAAYLSGKRVAPIETWFIHGNHENFDLLAAKEGQAVDPAGRLIFLSAGSVRNFHKGDELLRVAALGGMEYRFGKYPLPSEQRIQKYLHPTSLKRLQETRPEVDVLLLHDAPLNKGLRNKFPTGSNRITQLIKLVQPRFTFFGHYADPPEPFFISKTLCVGTNFAKARRIPNRDGAMGILFTEEWEFNFVEP